MVGIQSDYFPSAKSLAERLGLAVFEPSWWPSDVAKIGYWLDLGPDGARYRIGSVRPGGVPILCVGGPRNPTARLPEQDLDWREVSSLAGWRGLVAATDTGFRAVLDSDEHRLHLVGYISEQEVATAIASLRRVAGAAA
jgi:hypothetical protein